MERARVHRHWLMWECPGVSVRHDQIDTGRPPQHITPELVVVHYGVTRTLPALVAAQRARGYWAHLSIDGQAGRYGVHQALPFDVRGSHAGASEWRGRPSCNGFSVGIEIANVGPLIRKPDGRFVDVYGRPFDGEGGEPLHARHPNGGCPYEWWARFTDQEIDILVDVIGALRRAYPTIVDVRGHDEIATPRGRKIDPGPALDMHWLRDKVLADLRSADTMMEAR